MLSGLPDGTGAEHIVSLAGLGYDYAELPLAEMMQLGQEQFKAIMAHLHSSGIGCEVCNNLFPVTMRLTGDQADPPQRIRDYLRGAFDRAADVGSRKVVFGSGGAKRLPAGYPYEAGFSQLVDVTGLIGEEAAECGITIVLEPLNRGECNIINSVADAAELARQVGLPSVSALVDYYHLMLEKEPLTHLSETGAVKIKHVHFAEPDGRAYPKLNQAENYIPFFDALKAIGYDGTISCEAYSSDFTTDAAETLTLMKEYFTD